MRFSFKQVRHFLATVDAGQVSLAAIALNVSQSAVTTALQQLEGELGVSLFDRGPSGMCLTLEGARFVQHARNIMAAVNEAVSSPLTEDTSHTGRVRVGVTYTVAGYFLPRHLARFSRTYPGIKVDLVELPRGAIETGIVDRTLDIAVMLVSNLQNRRDTTYETLVYSRRRLWLSVEHPLLRASALTFEDIAKEPYIMLTVDEAGARPRSVTGSRPVFAHERSSAPPRSRPCAAWSPPEWASRSSPTWCTGHGRSTASASSCDPWLPTSPAWTLVLSGLRNASRLRQPSCFVNSLASTSVGLRVDGCRNDSPARVVSHPSFAG